MLYALCISHKLSLSLLLYSYLSNLQLFAHASEILQVYCSMPSLLLWFTLILDYYNRLADLV